MFRRLGVRSALRVPMPLGKDVFGSLFFLSREADRFSEDDFDFARRVADHLALALSHQRLAEAARRDAESRETAARLEAQVATLTRELEARTGQRRVVGQSKQWRDVLAQAARVAQTETTVLLTGESGTGKEVVARFIHHASRRGHGPFVAINCAALPDQLLESELFGYERGAFTGAVAAKPGRIEQANGGVLFLDEVGEMAPTVQAKLLRVLEEREFMRLGSTRLLHADIRVIAATNRDLHAAMQRGEFREDLYYRLGVFEIALPPLRDRLDDILELADVVPRGDWRNGRPAGRRHRRGRQGSPAGLRVAGQRARAAQRHRARRHPGRRRRDPQRAPAGDAPPRAVGRVRRRRRRRSPAGWRREPGGDRALAGGQSADAGAPQQDARRQAARPDARAVVFADREIRPGGDRVRDVLRTRRIVWPAPSARLILLAGATYQGVATALERRQFPIPAASSTSAATSCTPLLRSGRRRSSSRLRPRDSLRRGDGCSRPAMTTRVCSYDRAGLGWSEAGSTGYRG